MVAGILSRLRVVIGFAFAAVALACCSPAPAYASVFHPTEITEKGVSTYYPQSVTLETKDSTPIAAYTLYNASSMTRYPGDAVSGVYASFDVCLTDDLVNTLALDAEIEAGRDVVFFASYSSQNNWYPSGGLYVVTVDHGGFYFDGSGNFGVNADAFESMRCFRLNHSRDAFFADEGGRIFICMDIASDYSFSASNLPTLSKASCVLEASASPAAPVELSPAASSLSAVMDEVSGAAADGIVGSLPYFGGLTALGVVVMLGVRFVRRFSS